MTYSVHFCVIRLTSPQKSFNLGQDQKIWIRVPSSLAQRQYWLEVAGKHLCSLKGVRYQRVSNLKLVSCILVQSEDLRARVTIPCLCVAENVQFESLSHLVRQGRSGCSFGEINITYVWDKIWANRSSPEQRSSNNAKSCGLGREWRKWCNCTAFQKGRWKVPAGLVRSKMAVSPQ